jgi:hypothetical protein
MRSRNPEKVQENGVVKKDIESLEERFRDSDGKCCPGNAPQAGDGKSCNISIYDKKDSVSRPLEGGDELFFDRTVPDHALKRQKRRRTTMIWDVRNGFVQAEPGRSRENVPSDPDRESVKQPERSWETEYRSPADPVLRAERRPEARSEFSTFSEDVLPGKTSSRARSWSDSDTHAGHIEPVSWSNPPHRGLIGGMVDSMRRGFAKPEGVEGSAGVVLMRKNGSCPRGSGLTAGKNGLKFADLAGS